MSAIEGGTRVIERLTWVTALKPRCSLIALTAMRRRDYIAVHGHHPHQRRAAATSWARDARGPAGAARRRRLTLEGLADADADAGRLIDDEAMQAWADSLGTDHEVPIPLPS